jgi:hypothetical protein
MQLATCTHHWTSHLRGNSPALLTAHNTIMLSTIITCHVIIASSRHHGAAINIILVCHCLTHRSLMMPHACMANLLPAQAHCIQLLLRGVGHRPAAGKKRTHINDEATAQPALE